MSKVKMKPTLLLMLFTLFLLGLVSATPLNVNINVNNTVAIGVGVGVSGTPTSAVGATRVVPRRNGYSDLPLNYADYVGNHTTNPIPPYVMVSSPYNLDNTNAIRYSRADIYNALAQGYEVLQRTRDNPPGPWQTSGNMRYPFPIGMFARWNLAPTHLGEFGWTADSLHGTGPMYMYPLTWAGAWTGGFGQAPGFDRVVFNQNGIYLGVVTRRWDFPLPGDDIVADRDALTWRWCAAVDWWGAPIAQLRPDPLGWNYPGQPPLLGIADPLGYANPGVWRDPSLMRLVWSAANPGIPPGLGGSLVAANWSDTEDANPTSAGTDALIPYINASDPLDWPPEDNSTGTWRIWTPSNDTDADTDTAAGNNLTNEFIPDDCKYAGAHNQRYYWQQCQSDWPGGSQLRYRITISGTGQKNGGWCRGIMENIHATCGGNGNPSNYYSCNTKYPATVDWVLENPDKGSNSGRYFYGIDMHFTMKWPWAERDADHACVAKAVERASCYRAGVMAGNGKWCRAVHYYNPDMMEWDEGSEPPN
ncbi:hypothetical protein VPNG_05874 [Cytospora leucostoma]|uniref:Uncharacterized protein n=1 Tax=Cytospora leucostoma TaxID=1230097 RepID=A0A423X0A7_9PEZI|nr:hypothetical protein VPNG_05874 [Cytospora leucostoma]